MSTPDTTPNGETVVGTNTGHGHVWARPDGVRMRCGGPGPCSLCSKDKAKMDIKSDAEGIATLTAQRDEALERVKAMQRELDETVKMMRDLIAVRDAEIAELINGADL